MFKILIYVVLFAFFGCLISRVSIHFDFSTGWIGALLLVAWAFFSRKRWSSIARHDGNEPSPTERALWIKSAGYSLLLGHLVTSLLQTQIDIRFGSGNSLAIDSWLMVFALLVTEFIFRHDRQTKDERDTEFAAKGFKVTYYFLIAKIALLALYLALTPPSYREALTHFVLGNILIALLLTSYLVQLSTRIYNYAQDRADSDLNGYEQ